MIRREVLGDITNIRLHVDIPQLDERPKNSHGGRRNSSGKRGLQRRSSDTARLIGSATSLTNHSHTLELHSKLAALSNSPGRQLSKNEMRIIIRIAIWLQVNDNRTEFDAVEQASVWAGSSRHTIAGTYRHYINTGEIQEPDTSARGSGNITHPRHDVSLQFEQILSIHRLLGEARVSNTYVPARVIKERVGIELSVRQTRRIVKQIGYTWGRKRCVGKANKRQRTLRTRTFMHEYAGALLAQAGGGAIIVYTDESYIHTTHTNSYCWYSKSEFEGNHVRGSASKGKRLILLHAMTAGGLLHTNIAEGMSIASLQSVSVPALTCELIFEGLIDSDDYHKNMNGLIYMQWIVNRLIPTFKTMFPGKKCILVLDNASYHHPRGTDWINPNDMNKGALAAWMSQHTTDGMITIYRNGKERKFGTTSLFSHGSKDAPTLAEMKQWAKDFLSQRPLINRSLLRQRFDAEGWQLIYTPPYQCESQPIELLWAYVKNYVGRHTANENSVKGVTRRTRCGFYGDEASGHAAADATLCSRLVGHVHTWCNEFIKVDSELDGTIDALTDCYNPPNDIFDDMFDADEELAAQLENDCNVDDDEVDDDE